MTTFGDHEAADSIDTAPADPEQVARRLTSYYEGGRWEELTPTEQAARVAAFVRLLAWLRREGHRL